MKFILQVQEESSKLQDSDANKHASGLKSSIIWAGNYLLLKNEVTSEGAVFHNGLYYNQRLSIARFSN